MLKVIALIRTHFFKLLTIFIIISISLSFIIFILYKSNNKQIEEQKKVLHPSLYHRNDGHPYVPHPMGNNQAIPRIIHQTFKSQTINDMTSGMRNASRSFSSLPNFKYIYYNDDSAMQFLINHYGKDSDEFHTFNNIIPFTYKIDFWRLAVLYKIGGFYSDIDQILMKKLDTWIENNATMVLPVGYASFVWFGFDFAFIGSVPQHPLLRIAMDMIIYNVKNKFIPEVPRRLDEIDIFYKFFTVSGPVLMGKAYNRYLNEPDEVPHNIVKGRSLGIQFLGFCDTNGQKYFTTVPYQRNIRECWGERVVQFRYDEYRAERVRTTKPYWESFREGKIYRNIGKFT